MRLEDLRDEMPQTPEFISNMIDDEVKKQLNNDKITDMTRRRKMNKTVKVAALAAVCVMATSTAVYAGVKMYNMYTQKQGNYGISTGIKLTENANEIILPEKVHDIDITAGYIPNGMEWSDKTHLQNVKTKYTGGFSFDWVLLDNDDLDKVMQDKNVVESEERTFGDYQGVYLKYNDLAKDGSFNQRIYLLCPDLYRVITVYVGDDVTKEDAIKVASNLTITENDKMLKTKGLYTWSDMVSPEEVFGEKVVRSLDEDKVLINKTGQKFNIEAQGEDSKGKIVSSNEISACVDSVKIEDDLKLIDKENIPSEWLSAVGSDGKLVSNKISYVKSKYGINEVDKVVRSKDVKQKLVYATVTYTNNSDKEINHMLYMGSLMLINHNDNKYTIYNPAEMSGSDFDYVIWDGVADAAEMTYSSISENYGNGNNYIPSLKPGESITVNMAWIINEDDLDNMYLNLNGDGGAYEFGELTLESGIVKVEK